MFTLLITICVVLAPASYGMSQADMKPIKCCNDVTNMKHIRDTDNDCRYYYCLDKTLYPYNCTQTKRVPDNIKVSDLGPCTGDREAGHTCIRQTPLPTECTDAEKQKNDLERELDEYYRDRYGDGSEDYTKAIVETVTAGKCYSCNCQLDGEGGDPNCCNVTLGATITSSTCNGFCFVREDDLEGGRYLYRGCTTEFPLLLVNTGKNCEAQSFRQETVKWWFCDGDNCNTKNMDTLCP